jgi:hypothetical protein
MLCSDVDQKQMPFYVPPKEGWLAKLIGWPPLWLVVLALAGGAYTSFRHALPVIGTLLATAVGLVLAGMAIAVWKTPFLYLKLPLVLFRTNLRNLAYLVRTRVSSVLDLTTTVFMYRVRSLGYDVARLRMPNRFVASHIYDLGKPLVAPADIVARAIRARAVKTELWVSAARTT